MSLFTGILPGKISYSGAELRSHWVAERTGHFGDAVVAFRGPCSVKTGELVDLEDSRQGFFIEAREMLHFLGENFSGDLSLMIAMQRLFIASFAELLIEDLPSGVFIRRRGNDLFVRKNGEERKLSVSIATATPVSTLFHFGVNIDSSGAPVAAIGLGDLGVDVDTLARKTLERWVWEVESMRKARCKVLPR